MGFSLNQLEQERQIRKLQKKEDKDTKDYEQLSNLPKINNVELKGDKTTSDLGINADNVMMSDGVTSVENALDGVKSGLTNLLKYKVFNGTASDTTNHLYNTGVPVSRYVCVGGCTPNHPNYCVEISNIEISSGGYIRYKLYDIVTDQVVSDNAAYMVYLVFVDLAMLSELVITP